MRLTITGVYCLAWLALVSLPLSVMAAPAPQRPAAPAAETAKAPAAETVKAPAAEPNTELTQVPPAAAKGRPVTIARQWQGTYPDREIGRFPQAQRDATVGFINDIDTFAFIWQVWKPRDKMPEIDFTDNLVVIQFFTGTGPISGGGVSNASIEDGVLSWDYGMLSDAGGGGGGGRGGGFSRGPAGRYIVLAQVPRAGIQGIRGAGKVIPVAALANEPKEPGKGLELKSGNLKILDRWDGPYPAQELALLPQAVRDLPVGFIVDEKTFDDVWQAWKPHEKVPAVDFKTSLVVFTRLSQVVEEGAPPASALVRITGVSLQRGVLRVAPMWGATPPVEEGVYLAAAVVSRDGVKSVYCGPLDTLSISMPVKPTAPETPKGSAIWPPKFTPMAAPK